MSLAFHQRSCPWTSADRSLRRDPADRPPARRTACRSRCCRGRAATGSCRPCRPRAESGSVTLKCATSLPLAHAGDVDAEDRVVRPHRLLDLQERQAPARDGVRQPRQLGHAGDGDRGEGVRVAGRSAAARSRKRPLRAARARALPKSFARCIRILKSPKYARIVVAFRASAASPARRRRARRRSGSTGPRG